MFLSVLNIFVVIIGVIYIFKREKKLDFLSIYFFSSILYYFPIIINKLEYPYRVGKYVEFENIYWETYLVVFFNFILTLFLIYRKDNYQITNKIKIQSKFQIDKRTLDFSVFVFSVCSLVLLLYSIISLKNYLFNINISKMELMEHYTWKETWLVYIASLVPIYAFLSKGRYSLWTKIISIFLLSYTLLLQKRSVVVFFFITMTYLYLNNSKKTLSLFEWLKKHKKFLLLIVVFGLGVIIAKPLLPAVLSGNIIEVKRILTNLPNEIYNYLILGESNTISLNLNEVLRHGYTNNPMNYIYSLLSILPLSGTILHFDYQAISFTNFQSIFYPHFPQEIGFASTFLGELISTFQIIGGLAVLCLYLLLVDYLNVKIEHTDNLIAKTIIYAAFPLLTFYIHRNAIVFTIGYIKYYIYISIVILFFYFVFKKLSKYFNKKILF